MAPYLKSQSFYTYNATINFKHRACLFLATKWQKNEEKNLRRNRFTFYDFPNVKKHTKFSAEIHNISKDQFCEIFIYFRCFHEGRSCR